MKLIAALGLAFLLAACGPAASPSPTNHDIRGTLVLNGNDTWQISGPEANADCYGTHGYADIKLGAQVTVKDQSGAIIGTGTLGDGVWPDPPGTSCSFAFTVKKVPDATFYSIEVSHSGAVNYSAAEMAGSGWKVGLSLGDY